MAALLRGINIGSNKRISMAALRSIVESLGHTIVSVNIVAVEDNIFYGQLQFENGTTVSSRASDGLAVALRAKCRIWCADAVMDEAGRIRSVLGFLDRVPAAA